MLPSLFEVTFKIKPFNGRAIIDRVRVLAETEVEARSYAEDDLKNDRGVHHPATILLVQRVAEMEAFNKAARIEQRPPEVAKRIRKFVEGLTSSERLLMRSYITEMEGEDLTNTPEPAIVPARPADGIT